MCFNTQAFFTITSLWYIINSCNIDAVTSTVEYLILVDFGAKNRAKYQVIYYILPS